MESDYIIEDTDIRRLIVKAVEARESGICQVLTV